MDIWEEARRFFMKEKGKTQYMLIDLPSMEDHKMHGSDTRLVNTNDGVQLELERNARGSGDVNCHIFVISDSQMNIIEQQLESAHY